MLDFFDFNISLVIFYVFKIYEFGRKYYNGVFSLVLI